MPPCNSENIQIMRRSSPRTIYLTRHGESENNVYGKIGGNAPLSSRGEQYANALAGYINALNIPCQKVYTSRLQRTQQTAKHINSNLVVRPEIDEINAGLHDNLTYEDIAAAFPAEFALRDNDKLKYRYPQGESYLDVVDRLKPVLEELETEADNVLIISHQATIRCILTLLAGYPVGDLPYLKIPLHTLIKLRIDTNGISIEYLRLNVECVDTHRPKPDNCRSDRQIEDACVTVPFHY